MATFELLRRGRPLVPQPARASTTGRHAGGQARAMGLPPEVMPPFVRRLGPSSFSGATLSRRGDAGEQSAEEFARLALLGPAPKRDAASRAHTAARAGDGNTAYGLNAAADHFLTDAFSGGHIRTPRDRLIGSAKGNVESKIFHDLDNQFGVRVINARGDTWVAYGDNYLDDPRNARGRQLAMDAVRRSRQDISDALTRGQGYPEPKPDTAFAAELLVPHPLNPNEDRFTGRVPTYVAINGIPVRVPDDYTRERDKLAVTEGPGILSSFFTDDNEIRAGWRSRASPGWGPCRARRSCA
ncbi:MAG TPA: hypothetical protein VI456_03985 [Polyangia bacterium]